MNSWSDTSTFAREKIDLPKENLPRLPEVNLSRVSFFPGEEVTLRKNHIWVFTRDWRD